MYDSLVAGQTNFLYGFGTLFVSHSTLLLRSCGGGITAWKGTNTSFANKYGVYISESRVVAANTTSASQIAGKCSLGRPWNALHRSVFMETYLDASILPAGYTTWAGRPGGNIGANTTMAVYKTFGPGEDDAAQRAGGVTAVFSESEVRSYRRPVDVFLGDIDWIDPIALS